MTVTRTDNTNIGANSVTILAHGHMSIPANKTASQKILPANPCWQPKVANSLSGKAKHLYTDNHRPTVTGNQQQPLVHATDNAKDIEFPFSIQMY